MVRKIPVWPSPVQWAEPPSSHPCPHLRAPASLLTSGHTYTLCPFPFRLAPSPFPRTNTDTWLQSPLLSRDIMAILFITLYFKFYIKASFLFLLFFLWHLLGVPVLFSPKLPGMSFLGLRLFHLSMSEMREMGGAVIQGRECGLCLHHPASPSSCWVLILASLLQHEHPFHLLFDREICAFKELQGNMGNHFLVYILEKMKARKALKWSCFSSWCIVIT